MFYSKTGRPHGRFKNVESLDRCDLSCDYINFYWNIFDESDSKVEIHHCLDYEHIETLITNPTAVLHLDFKFEIITLEDVNRVKIFVNQHQIPKKQVKIYVQDDLQKSFVLSHLDIGVQIYHRHFITIDYHPRLQTLDQGIKKFSFLCRRHTNWRLELADKLYNEKILKNSYWSYLGIDTDNNENFCTELKNEKQRWLNKIPKKISPGDKGKNQDELYIYKAIHSSLIHILVETVYDQTYYTGLEYYDYDAMPTDISEKTFKAVSLKKPFLVFSTPYWLQDFRSLGFRTFSPYIDESYDLEENNETRIQLLINELLRLHKLKESELSKIVTNCADIVEHNFKIWKNVYDQYDQKTVDIF